MYDLIQELFSVLNMIKGFKAGIYNPRKELYIAYNSKVYRLEPVEIAGVTTIEEVFKREEDK